MKPAQTIAINSGPPASRRGINWLTLYMVCAALTLFASLAAIAVDLWLSQSPDRPAAEALAPAQAAASPTPTPPATPSPLPVPSEPPTPTLTPTAATPPPCVPPDDWTIHVVEEGNTLYSLGRRYGTDVNTLKLVNCLNTDTIFIGQRLYVPGPLPTVIVVHEEIPDPGMSIPTQPPTATSIPTATPDALGTAANGPPEPTPSATPTAAFQVNIPDNYINIILLGSDKRPTGRAWRTDSMIIVSIDVENEVVRLLSLPRDLWVYIPDHGYNRINTADLWGELAQKGGGPEQVKQTIYQNLGIPIDYYVRVDFQGFIKIIDTVGGVDIDVECPLPDIDLLPGMHHMNGEDALRYARSRKSTNDFDRGRRQRKVLMALWDQALTLDVVPRLPQLWLTMADSFKTDLPLEKAINLAYLGTTIGRQRIRSKAIDASMTQSWTTPEGAAVLLPREDKIRAALESFYAPLSASELDTGTQVRVQVMNGWPRPEAEQLAAAALRWEGYKVVSVGLLERQDVAKTEIVVYTGDQACGERIARMLGVPLTSVRLEVVMSPTIEALVILGADYNPCGR
ncbi:MAG: LCP family protein [Anaerolineae bacterium]|nr:LCP family protein [Anaerolineae bacterium]